MQPSQDDMQQAEDEAGGTAASPARSGRGFLLLAVMLVIGLGVVGERFIGASRGSLAEAPPAASRPVFSQIGNRIVVPAASPLRSRLVLADAVSKESPIGWCCPQVERPIPRAP